MELVKAENEMYDLIERIEAEEVHTFYKNLVQAIDDYIWKLYKNDYLKKSK